MSSSRIELEASEWLARLDVDEADERVREAAERWRAADPRHEVAWLCLRASWEQMGQLRALRPADDSRIDPDLLCAVQPRVSSQPDATLDSPTPLAPTTMYSRYSMRRRVALVAAVLVAAVVAGALAYLPRSQSYETGIGGFERVVLSDGSVMELNTDTRVRVSFGRRHRLVSLSRGEASFKVTRDRLRPFVVTAGETAVRVVGTAFSVRRRETEVEVIVTEGKVAIGQATLSAGQAVIISGGQLRLRDLHEDSRDAGGAWQSGMLVYTGEPLSEVIAEINRYNERQLVIRDAAIAKLRIGGYFSATDLDLFLGTLESDFGLRAVPHDREVELRAASGTK